MTITASSAQVASTPTQVGGTPALSAQFSLTSSALTHTGVALVSQLVGFQSRPFGTLTGDCSLQLQVSVDGGTNYSTFKTYTNAQIANNTGLHDTVSLKGTHWRFALLPGTMTGGNGINVRALD